MRDKVTKYLLVYLGTHIIIYASLKLPRFRMNSWLDAVPGHTIISFHILEKLKQFSGLQRMLFPNELNAYCLVALYMIGGKPLGHVDTSCSSYVVIVVA